MSKRTNAVYAAGSGGIAIATGSQPKDTLLFATSSADLDAIIRGKIKRMSEANRSMLARIEQATARC